MICPRCWQTIPDDAAVCPSCGQRRATVSPAKAQAATEPRVIPVLTGAASPRSNTPAPSPDETPTLLAPSHAPDEAADEVSADGATAWASVPPLLTRENDDLDHLDHLDDVPFAMTAAPATPAAPVAPTATTADTADTPAAPAEPATEPNDEPADEPTIAPDGKPAGDGLPDYETPDVERPAIHLPRAPLPDYDTPDEERPAIHPTAPDTGETADAPDIADTPVPAQLAPITPFIEALSVNGSNGTHSAYDEDEADEEDDADDDEYDGYAGHDAPTIAEIASIGTGAVVSDAADAADVASTGETDTTSERELSFPEAYTSPHAGRVDRTGFAQASASPAPHASYQAASSDPIERFFGAQPPPRERVANNAIQRLWQRFVPPEWATAPWISIPVGALVALALGLLASVIGLLLWGRAIAWLLGATDMLGASANLVNAVLSPNLLQLLLLEHGVPMALALGAPGGGASFSALETLPLTGLSLIPAIALILGGYVAAASDFTGQLRFSVLRGALVGPIYGILLLLVALFGSSAVRVGQGIVIQLHPSLGVAFLAGLIWGTLLGALGGLLAVRRHHLFTTTRRPDLLAGASWGALIALGSGLLLALVALAAGVMAHAVGTVPTATGETGGGLGGALNAVVVAIALLVVVAPVAALWLFTLGTGTNIESWLNTTGLNAPAGAPGATGATGTSTFGLLAAQHHPTSAAWWLMLLIPLASYIIGGRAAAHIARADSLRDGALAGWLMAVALSLLMLVLTLLSRVVLVSDATVGPLSITTSLGIAPASLAVFLLILLVGGVIGALSGASAVLAPQSGPVIAMAAAPLLPRMEPALSLARQPWDMLDAVRGRPTSRTPLRALLYAALLAAIVLVALFLIVALLGWIASHFAPISAVRGFDGFFAGLAVGVPLLALASAVILLSLRALPPLLRRSPARGPVVLPRYPTPR